MALVFLHKHSSNRTKLSVPYLGFKSVRNFSLVTNRAGHKSVSFKDILETFIRIGPAICHLVIRKQNWPAKLREMDYA